ncbi:MAG: tRNA (adenosine(37)-N6)-threonylcarbamoyltransferase complex ATPase subunit type 1 TsaE [Oscillospiraceae bacterium]|nr:tRNA (adenosine(37)-N6)-threonylcarbamoyltransferase complex ATPase subunit type 1 TsaE [Oscillospiraceae bacterium]
MLQFECKDQADTQQAAEALAKLLRPGDVIAYRGGMGAGKTTFTRSLCAALGIDAWVSSPTFALVHEYPGKDFSLCHFDMYRIGSFDELYSTGFFDYLDRGDILAVEWSENIEGALPEGTIFATFEITGETGRIITVEGVDDREPAGH